MTNFTDSSHSLSELSSGLSAADIELIENFVLGKKKTIPQSGRLANAAAHLQVEYSDKAMKLLDRRGGLVAVSKQVNEWQQKVLLNNQVEGYMSVLCATLERHDFVAARKSRHPDYVEYSKYQTPEGYKLQYQPAHVMGRAWLERYARSSGVQSRSLLVFQGGNWFPIQELKIDQRTLQLRTLLGETIVDSNDYLVWIEQSVNEATASVAATPKRPKSSRSRSSSATPIATLAPEVIDLGLAEETVYVPEDALSDLSQEIAALHMATRSTPNMTRNLPTDQFPKQDQQNSPNPVIPDPATKELMDAIKAKTLKRLLDYVKNGEKVVITEILKNGQDQVITTKTTEIERGCPRWVIERLRGAMEF
jgi:hypothetical protein